MSTESEEGRRIVASLALRVKHVADIDQVADVIITMLRDTDASLVPIIGPKGVAALYRRSLHLSTSLHPCLLDTYIPLADPLDLIDLNAILILQNRNDAIFFCQELLKALYELLATLIGSSLSRRLLLDVWDNDLSAPPSQETSP
ncbi:hypothetical protein ACYZTX_14275 [Pseudomonas sp. MDT1-17]